MRTTDELRCFWRGFYAAARAHSRGEEITLEKFRYMDALTRAVKDFEEDFDLGLTVISGE